ncbi:glycoside hydrolase family 108 protein [Caulobacter hibisci]|uniref:Glycoside hydrolase family 108 protein n=2 Tax=Caulobacter hibisci TaxID=2035993 RepID=A0ABS0SXX3_9CAUL|nr:glycoside hydrolase family 108 protein [Caulobacter hibisci]
MTFDAAFEILIGHEGGYVNDPRDPGGETKFGISKRSYPNEDIKALSLARAKAIYYDDFWRAAGCDKVAGLAFDLFDTAVNSGVRRAVEILQEAVGARTDAVLGPKTLAAALAFSPDAARRRFNAIRLRFMTDLPIWSSFGKGWARRVADNLMRE